MFIMSHCSTALVNGTAFILFNLCNHCHDGMNCRHIVLQPDTCTQLARKERLCCCLDVFFCLTQIIQQNDRNETEIKQHCWLEWRIIPLWFIFKILWFHWSTDVVSSTIYHRGIVNFPRPIMHLHQHLHLRQLNN